MDPNEQKVGNVSVVESDGLVPKPGAANSGPESNTASTLQPENTGGNILDKAADIVTQAEKRDGELTGAPAPAEETIINKAPQDDNPAPTNETAKPLNVMQPVGAPDETDRFAATHELRQGQIENTQEKKQHPVARVLGMLGFGNNNNVSTAPVTSSEFKSGADVPTTTVGADATVTTPPQETAATSEPPVAEEKPVDQVAPTSNAGVESTVATQSQDAIASSEPPVVPVTAEKPVDQAATTTTNGDNSESPSSIDASVTTSNAGAETTVVKQFQDAAVSPDSSAVPSAEVATPDNGSPSAEPVPPMVASNEAPITEEKTVDQASTPLTDSTIPESTSPGLNSESSNTQDAITQSPDTQLNSTTPNPNEAAPNVINTPEAVSPPPSFDTTVSAESPVDATANALTPDINPQASSDAISSQAETQSDTQNPAPPEIPQIPNSVPESLGSQSPIPAGLDHLSDAGHAIVTPQIPNTPSEINANVTDSNVNPFASGSPVGESSTQQTQSTNATEQAAPVNEASSTANSINTIEDHATTQPQASVDSTNVTSEIGAQAQVNMPNPLDVSVSTPMPDLVNKTTEEAVTQGQTAVETPDPLAVDAPITPVGGTPSVVATATFGSGSSTVNSTETNINSGASVADPGGGKPLERWQAQTDTLPETPASVLETPTPSPAPDVPAQVSATEMPAPTIAATPEQGGSMSSTFQTDTAAQTNTEISGDVLGQATSVAQDAGTDNLTGAPAPASETPTPVQATEIPAPTIGVTPEPSTPIVPSETTPPTFTTSPEPVVQPTPASETPPPVFAAPEPDASSSNVIGIRPDAIPQSQTPEQIAAANSGTPLSTVTSEMSQSPNDASSDQKAA